MAISSVDVELKPFTQDQVINLLGIYATQVGSYTTLLWQVPALSLTAQSFLLTIALSGTNEELAKVTAAGLSVVISLASYALMHDQRGRAINYGELAMRLSRKLELGRLIETDLKVPDGVPSDIHADDVWTWHREEERRLEKLEKLEKQVTPKAGLMYAVWKGCMVLFFLVDVGIILSVFISVRMAILIPAIAGLVGLLIVGLRLLPALPALIALIPGQARRAWWKVTRNKPAALSRQLEDIGAPDPRGRAQEEIRENTAQQARYLALRRIWAGALTPWRDGPAIGRDPALMPLLGLGVDPDLLATVVRRVVFNTVNAVIDVIDEGRDPAAPGTPGWALIEARPDGITITGRAVGSLHKDLLEADPLRAKAADFR